MSSRQDYISKVRYQNDLPAPSCPPKLLKYKSIPSNHESLASSDILTSIFRKQNFQKYIGLHKDSNLQDPFALPLDLIEVPGIFGDNDNSALYSLPFSDTNKSIALHEKDKELLRDPEFSFANTDGGKSGAIPIAAASSSRNVPADLGNPSVSFLRKTEYISNKSNFLITSRRNKAVPQRAKKSKNESLDPESQLANIELSFEQASETLAGPGMQKLRHPTKKHLRPVKTWSLVPNTEMMDQTYFSTKFSGSASLSRTDQYKKYKNIPKEVKEQFNGVNSKNPILTTSIFKPITLTDEEWMSFFVLPDYEKSQRLKRKIDALELDEEESYKFKFNKNFELKYDNFELNAPLKQIAITLNEKPSAMYLPIQGKIELKKKRLETEKSEEMDTDFRIDEINFKIREGRDDEELMRDQERSRFDPYNYVAQIDEEE